MVRVRRILREGASRRGGRRKRSRRALRADRLAELEPVDGVVGLFHHVHHDLARGLELADEADALPCGRAEVYGSQNGRPTLKRSCSCATSNAFGMHPASWFPLSHSPSRLARFPSSLGIGPLSSLLCRLNLCSS